MLAVLVSLILSPVAVNGDAAVTINKPTWKGYRLDWCDTWGANCGQPAAADYCAREGYKANTVLNYKEDPNIGNTKVISSDAICPDSWCDGFLYITCRRTSETFTNPQYDGYALDWCRQWETDCGQDSANGFCQLHGYASASAFTKHPGVGLTRLLTGAVCQASFCDSFYSITCV